MMSSAILGVKSPKSEFKQGQKRIITVLYRQYRIVGSRIKKKYMQ